MAAADKYLKRLLIVLSVVLVILLAVVSIYSVLPDQAAETDPVLINDPAAPERAYPGQIFEIDDLQFPLSVGCRAGLSQDNVFLAFIENRGQTATSYIVAAVLFDSNGQSVEAIAEVPDLRPGEQREAVLLPRENLDGVSRCSITAVQGDRRVLLSS